MFGPDLVQETTEKIRIIRKRMVADQNRQKSYADKHHVPLEFAMEDMVFLKAMKE